MSDWFLVWLKEPSFEQNSLHLGGGGETENQMVAPVAWALRVPAGPTHPAHSPQVLLGGCASPAGGIGPRGKAHLHLVSSVSGGE